MCWGETELELPGASVNGKQNRQRMQASILDASSRVAELQLSRVRDSPVTRTCEERALCREGTKRRKALATTRMAGRGSRDSDKIGEAGAQSDVGGEATSRVESIRDVEERWCQRNGKDSKLEDTERAAVNADAAYGNIGSTQNLRMKRNNAGRAARTGGVGEPEAWEALRRAGIGIRLTGSGDGDEGAGRTRNREVVSNTFERVARGEMYVARDQAHRNCAQTGSKEKGTKRVQRREQRGETRRPDLIRSSPLI
ncbi:hypothetical protein B0H13DRAFT_1893962 [Mycena leptocephala]|nr:hypothetical protein B0H13DRAFT_1893962 [Mycena leptocephala]